MKKYMKFIILSSCILCARTIESDPAKAWWWDAIGNWFHQAAETVSHAFQPAAQVCDTVIDDVAKVADSAVQLVTTAAGTVTHLAATAATVVTNVAAAASGDITGDHTLFNNVAAHVDTAIAGAADAVTVVTNTVATLATTGIDTAALTITHPQLAKQVVQYEGAQAKTTLQTAGADEVAIGKAEVAAQVQES